MAKEAYLYGKTGLFVWQNWPICMAKEAYSHGKRGPFAWQKRPICMGMYICMYDASGCVHISMLHLGMYIFLGCGGVFTCRVVRLGMYMR